MSGSTTEPLNVCKYALRRAHRTNVYEYTSRRAHRTTTSFSSSLLRAADRLMSLIVEALLIAVYLGNERLLIDIRDTINRTPYLSYTIQLVLLCCLRPPRSAGACPAEPVRAGESQPKRGLFSTDSSLNKGGGAD
jgi:hypothetical protein